MTRRYRSTGRFMPAPPLATVPLFEAALRRKSPRHQRAANARWSAYRARIDATTTALRCELAMRGRG